MQCSICYDNSIVSIFDAKRGRVISNARNTSSVVRLGMIPYHVYLSSAQGVTARFLTTPYSPPLPLLYYTTLDYCVYYTLCCHPIYSGRQGLWTDQPGSPRRKGHTEFLIHLLRCLPYFSRERDSAVPFPRRP